MIQIAEYFEISPENLANLLFGDKGTYEVDVPEVGKVQIDFPPFGSKTPGALLVSSGKRAPRRTNALQLEAWDIGVPTPIEAMRIAESDVYGMLGSRKANDLGFTFINNDTMTPTLQHGDMVFLADDLASDKDIAEDGIYLIEFDKQYHIKRLQKVAGRIAVKSDNPLYDTWYVDEEDMPRFRVLARAIRSMSIKLRTLG